MTSNDENFAIANAAVASIEKHYYERYTHYRP